MKKIYSLILFVLFFFNLSFADTKIVEIIDGKNDAKINLIKLTSKTHPADLAVVFRHFQDEEQLEIFSLMKEITFDFDVAPTFTPFCSPFSSN